MNSDKTKVVGSATSLDSPVNGELGNERPIEEVEKSIFDVFMMRSSKSENKNVRGEQNRVLSVSMACRLLE